MLFTVPIHEVNHCHGTGTKGHPCEGGSKKSGPVKFVSRGLAAHPDGLPVALVQRLVSKKATAKDVLKTIDVGRVGNYWWLGEPDEFTGDPTEFADFSPSDSLAVTLKDYRSGKNPHYYTDGIGGDIGVILHGKQPKGFQPDDFGSYVDGPFTVELSSIEYNAGTGWVTVDANGLTVKQPGRAE